MASNIAFRDITDDASHHWRWTRTEYTRLNREGFFIDRRVELVDGEIVRMNSQGPRHVRAAHRVVKALERAVGAGFWVRMQAPLALSEWDEPEPDAAVVPGSDDDYEEHPTTALLVVEVSEATRRFDLVEKALRYAAVGIPEYWVVDLVADELIIFQEPTAAGYATRVTKTPGDTICLRMLPSAMVAVEELFPSRHRPANKQ